MHCILQPEGNSEWSYFYLTVIKKTGGETTAPATTSDETSAPATSSDDKITDGYYLIGNINDWDVNKLTAAEKLAENSGAAGEYTLDYTFKDGDEIKVVKVENGAIKTWYNDGGDNYKLTDAGNKTGECTVYFRPEGNSEWSYFYLTVIKKTGGETTTPATTSDETTAPATSSDKLEDGYYLVGTLNGKDCWSTNITADRKLKANEGAEGEYYLDYTFYNNDEIKVVKVVNGEVTNYYNPDGENYKLTDAGNKTGECTVYFRPEGNSEWSYFYLTVIKKTGGETTAPATTSDETSAPATSSDDKITDGYYLIGNINDWDVNKLTAAEKFAANEGAQGEYMLEYTFKDGDEIKVVKVENGAIKTWYNDNGENYKLTDEGNKTGECTVYFRPEGNPEWTYFYLTVIKKTSDETTAPATAAPATTSDETTAPATSSDKLEDGYYLVGTLNGKDCWSTNITADRKLKANEGAQGEYYLDYTFYNNDEIKVVKVVNGEVTNYYNPDGENYKLTDAGNKTGECTVYFRPEGNSEWTYFYLTVIKKTSDETTAPATAAPATTSDETTATAAPSTLTDGYYLIGNMVDWDVTKLTAAEKFAANEGAQGEYMLEYTFKDGDEIKAVKVENGAIKTWYNDSGENYKLTDAGNKTGECTVYFRPEGNSEWTYFYLTVIKKTSDETTAPATAAPATTSDETTAPATSSDKLEDGYYLVGTLNGKDCWSTNITADRKLKANEGAEGEYYLDYTFYNNDEIKVVKVVNGEVTNYYNPDGENYKLTDAGNKTGECTVYFRPEGNSEWSYFYLTVIKKTSDETTAPATAAPATTSDETTATAAPSTLTDGYYLIGNIVDWDVTKLTAAESSRLEGAQGEYMLEYTFKNNDEIKAVKVENGEIKTWYNDGGENYKLTDEGNKTGECTVYFRPEGNSEWTYFYLTVIKKTSDETTAPATAAPATTSDETTAPATSSDDKITDGYYLIGNINDWDVNKLTAAEKFAANEGAQGEYMLEYTFKDGDAIKAVKVENGEIKTWYKDGGENYKLTDG